MAELEYTELRLSSGNGVVTRKILTSPPRDALPSEIPVIDVSRIFSPALEHRLAVAKRVAAAATNTGFFYIKNHGVAESTITSASEPALHFFRQDEVPKLHAASEKVQDQLYGYQAAKTQIVNRDDGVDTRESFFWRYDPRTDPDMQSSEYKEGIPAYYSERPTSDEFAQAAGQVLPAGFVQGMDEYCRRLIKLARALTRTFALSLGLEEDAFDKQVRYPEISLTINYYPPKLADDKLDKATQEGDRQKTVAIGSHTDFQFFTILWQDDIGGLQVVNRDGQWIRAVPVPGTFVVNIADYLQRITNDRYLSSVHRVQGATGGKERLSIPFFWGFGLDESCGVVKSCVGEGEEVKYEEVSCREWIERRMADMLDVNKGGY